MNIQRTFDGDFSKAKRVSKIRYSRAFPGDDRMYLAEAEYWQRAEFFVREPLGKQLPENKGYRLVSESAVREIGNGIIEWTRFFARQPDPRVEWQSHAWRRPGFSNTGTYFQKAFTAQPVLVGSNLRFTVSGNHGLKTGDSVRIRYLANIPSVGDVTRTVMKKVEQKVSDSAFDVLPIIDEIKSYTSMEPMGLRRPVETRVVTSRIEIVYAHIGAIGDAHESPEEIPTVQPVTIFNNDIGETDTYSSETNPSVVEYLADVVANNWIVVEATIIERWLGNFYSASTRKVRAD